MHALGRLQRDPKAKAAELPPVSVWYRRADGQVVEHQIVPSHAWYGTPGGNPPEWEGECQWSLYAWDVDQQEYVDLVLNRLVMGASVVVVYQRDLDEAMGRGTTG